MERNIKFNYKNCKINQYLMILYDGRIIWEIKYLHSKHTYIS